MQALLVVGLALFLIALILSKPYLGIVFTLVSLPVVDLLPEIPFFSSILGLIGIVTLVRFFALRKNETRKLIFQYNAIHVVGFFFIIWIFLSNYQAAWFGYGRNWFLTFFQLLVLTWLTGELLDSPEKQRVFMWSFAVVSAVVAIISIQQGNIGDTISVSTRASGLAGNPNSTGRYLVVSMVFFSYLSSITEKRIFRLLAFVGIIVTFLGVFFTLSRTSILLIFVAVALQNIFVSRKKISLSIVVAYIAAGLILWLLSDRIIDIIQSILPSILQGSDTAGLRYKLWQAAWRMWLENPVQGIGIGNFPVYLKYFADGVGLAPHYWGSLPHNTYLSALAETGLVGFIFFGTLLVLSFRNFLQMGKVQDDDIISLRNIWLVVFITVLLAEITANGLYDKMLWFLFGISIYFRNLFLAKINENNTDKQVNKSILHHAKRF